MESFWGARARNCRKRKFNGPAIIGGSTVLAGRARGNSRAVDMLRKVNKLVCEVHVAVGKLCKRCMVHGGRKQLQGIVAFVMVRICVCFRIDHVHDFGGFELKV